MDHFDLAVVGGSFAGLACAQEAARQGLRTQVYDAKHSPGAHTQSTGLLVKEVAEHLQVPSHLTRRINGVRLYAPNMNSIDLYSPHYYFLATDTCAVLDWMAQQARKAGAKISSGVKVGDENNSIINKGNRIELTQQNATCSYLVGADGALSDIAQQCNLGTNNCFLFGAEYELEGFNSLDDHVLHVFLDSEHAPGYIGWLVRGVHHTQLGIATKASMSTKLKPFLNKLLKHFNENADIIGGRGGLIPCGGIVNPIARGNICLLGDAAGMVSPLTAGGIHTGMETGQHLARAIADYLLYGGEAPEKRIRESMPNYRFKRQLRKYYNHLTPPNSLFNYALGNRLFQRIARLVFFHNRGLFCAEAWRDILFQHD